MERGRVKRGDEWIDDAGRKRSNLGQRGNQLQNVGFARLNGCFLHDSSKDRKENAILGEGGGENGVIFDGSNDRLDDTKLREGIERSDQ